MLPEGFSTPVQNKYVSMWMAALYHTGRVGGGCRWKLKGVPPNRDAIFHAYSELPTPETHGETGSVHPK